MPQGYNEDDFAEMQRQAIKRVKEMQQRARPPAMSAKERFEQNIFEGEEKESVEANRKQSITESAFVAEKSRPVEALKPKRDLPQIPKQSQHTRQKQSTERKQQGMLSSLFKLDSDISLILPLLLLLGREGADDILLLALLYIMA